MKKIILTGCVILITISFIQAQNVSDPGESAFRNYLNNIIEGLDKREKSLEYYSSVIDSIQQLEISLNPEFF